MPELCAPDIYRIRIPLPRSPLRYTNCYVLLGGEPLVVDTGFAQPECRDALLTGLGELGLRPGDCRLFLTHFHADHAGLAGIFAQQGSPVYLGAADAPFAAESGSGKLDGELAYYARAGVPEEELAQLGQSHPGYHFADRRPISYTLLTEGDTLPAAGRHFSCLLTPGHTPGHLCLFSPEDGLLLSGDHLLFDISPNIVEWDCLPNSLGCYQRSLQRLLQLPIRQTLPGHRESGEAAARVEELLQHHRLRLEQTLDILRRAPGSTAYQVAAQLSWNIRSKDWAHFPLSQRWFAVGEALAHLSCLLAEGRAEEESIRGVSRYRAV